MDSRLKAPFARTSLFLFLLACAGPCHAQVTRGEWNEVVGQQVVNNEGVTLGHVSAAVLDVENGRYVGLVVSYGGFLGLGRTDQIVPAGALEGAGKRGTLILNLDTARFRAAPTMPLSNKLGPPSATKLAEIYHYYGQAPYFTTTLEATPSAGEGLAQLGFIQTEARILNLPVENLQGKTVGTVAGIRGMEPRTGYFTGVVIRPIGMYGGDFKFVEPQVLRYNSRHDRLRLNDHEQEFRHSPDFTISSSGHFTEDSPVRPGEPLPPLIQGNSGDDKKITTAIWDAIQADHSLSHYAKTIEVGTVRGKTIVRGRVSSIANRNQILAYATQYAGAGNVADNITVQVQSQREVDIDSH